MSMTFDDFNFIISRSTSSQATDETYKMLTVGEKFARESLSRTAVFKILIECSTATGGYVQFQPELGYLPALIDNNSRPVFVYQFVEALDNLIDYERVKEEFPSLSYAQIDGAIAFLRKVAQLNVRGIDIDALEDDADAQDAELIGELRTALSDRETARVLHND